MLWEGRETRATKKRVPKSKGPLSIPAGEQGCVSIVSVIIKADLEEEDTEVRGKIADVELYVFFPQ